LINKFKRARLISGQTQTEVAEKLGVSAVTVHKWENGESFPRVKRLKSVADVLHVSVADLLEEERAV